MMQKRDVELLFEVGSLRFIQRTWRQFFREDVANNSEHSFRVAWIALILARSEKVKSDEKILKMALVHDLGESRCLDTNYISKIYCERDENRAIKNIFEDTSLDREFVELFGEYEQHKTLEAQIVKDADWLDVDFEMQEKRSEGNDFTKIWPRTDVYEKLYTKSAKGMWKKIKVAESHDWHLNAHKKYRGAKKT